MKALHRIALLIVFVLLSGSGCYCGADGAPRPKVEPRAEEDDPGDGLPEEEESGAEQSSLSPEEPKE